MLEAVAEFDGYYTADIRTYEANCGYSHVPLTNILLNVSGTPGYSGLPNDYYQDMMLWSLPAALEGTTIITRT
jgi:hypothetical protein